MTRLHGLLLKTQARARRFSVAALVFYLGILLLAFGHHCGPADAHSEHAAGHGLSQALHGEHTAGHHCPACAWQRDSVSTPAAAAFITVPALLSLAGSAALVLNPLTGAPLTAASRGPPHA